MKKIFTTLFAVCAFYGYSHAQTTNGTEFGVFAGIGGATVTTGSNQNTNNNLRFVVNAGVSADYYFSDRWSLKVKALYDQKGWANGGYMEYLNSSLNAVSYKVDYHVNYITVPVMANWHFGRNRNWFLDFGPYVGFLMSAKTSGEINADVKYAFNSTDAGLAYGIGIKFRLAERTKFYIELDGQAGVADAVKGSGDSFLNSRSGLSVGVNF